MTTPRTVLFISDVKWRNQLLALGCLLAFAAFGVLYFQHWVVQKPFGIVLFIGEGLTPERLAAARAYAGGADTALALDSLPHTALLTNYSSDFATPDSAAAASALATGVKVSNRALAVNADGKAIANLIELAHAAGRATGLITDGLTTDPTAAAFYAHATGGDDRAQTAQALTDGGALDLSLGGGSADFTPLAKGGYRTDGRDLTLEMRRKGFDLVRTKAELEAVPRWRRPKVFGLFASAELAFADQLEARAEQPSLADMVRRGIELLQFNRTGYLLVVDAALMRKAAQRNDGEQTLLETLELDRAVATAQKYVGHESMIIVCGDVGIGGLTISGAPFRRDRGIALLGLNSAGDPSLTWATGPNGTISYGAAKVLASPEPAQANNEPENAVAQPEEPAAFYAKSALNTLDDVIAYGSGNGTDALHGTLDNTAIFRLVRDHF
ncbi:MAG: alkaline phosphatase [Verrucomicrobiota bacterium]|nr:alkaline phosphatase [Verrucomicrobiota bacterium]